MALLLVAGCGEASAGTPSRSPSSAPPSSVGPVRLGAPFAGQWVPISYDCAGVSFPSSCSRPAVHHWLGPEAAPSGDWAVDLGAVAGTPVRLFASARAGTVTAHVEQVRPACRKVRNGGSAVTVGLYVGETRIGSATYAHLEPVVAAGDEVAVDGAVLGQLGTYFSGSCWQGPHLHLQLKGDPGPACFVARPDRSRLRPADLLGWTSARGVTAVRSPCPAGDSSSLASG